MYITASQYGSIDNVTVTGDDNNRYVHINFGDAQIGMKNVEAAKLAADLAAMARKQVESTHVEVAA